MKKHALRIKDTILCIGKNVICTQDKIIFYLKLPVTFGIYLFSKSTNLLAYSLIVIIDLCLMRFLLFYFTVLYVMLSDFLFNEIYYYSIILYFSVEFDVFSCILNYYRIVNFLCIFFNFRLTEKHVIPLNSHLLNLPFSELLSWL